MYTSIQVMSISILEVDLKGAYSNVYTEQCYKLTDYFDAVVIRNIAVMCTDVREFNNVLKRYDVLSNIRVKKSDKDMKCEIYFNDCVRVTTSETDSEFIAEFTDEKPCYIRRLVYANLRIVSSVKNTVIMFDGWFLNKKVGNFPHKFKYTTFEAHDKSVYNIFKDEYSDPHKPNEINKEYIEDIFKYKIRCELITAQKLPIYTYDATQLLYLYNEWFEVFRLQEYAKTLKYVYVRHKIQHVGEIINARESLSIDVIQLSNKVTILENTIQQLQNELTNLREDMAYAPPGEKYIESLEHFQEIVNKID